MSPVAAAPSPAHIGLNVTDLDRSREFYREVFGLAVLKESPDPERRFAFLGSEGRTIVTLWQQSRSTFSADRSGLHHLAFLAPSLEALEAIEGRLRRLGARIHHGGIVAHAEGQDSGGLFFEDPDGIRLEVALPTGLAGRAAPSGAAPTCGFF